MTTKKLALYDKIQIIKNRIVHGNSVRMRKAGEEEAPAKDAFKSAEKIKKSAASH